MIDIKEFNKLQQIKDEMMKENKLIKNEIESKNVKVAYVDTQSNYNRYNIEAKKSQRMQIWYVNLGKKNGSVQGGIRPCLLSSNIINDRFSTIRNVFPITSKVNSKANIPVHVEIEGYGLEEKSLILTEQITTVDVRYDLMYYVGTVDEILMKRVDNARNIQLGDIKQKTTFDRLNNEKQQYVINQLNIIKDCNIVLKFLKRLNGNKKDIDLAEDEKFCAENSLMTFCYENSINPNEFYSADKGINEEFRDKLIAL